MSRFAQIQQFLTRSVPVGSKTVPLWQVACVSTVALVVTVKVVRRALRPKFGFHTTGSTVMENVDLSGQIIIVTGSNTGLGKATARHILAAGAITIMACRNPTKAKNAMNDIINSFPNNQQEEMRNNLKFIQLDLGDLDSVYNFVEEFANTYDRLDQLVNNAGMTTPKFGTTKQGFETQFGINHIGTSYLTLLLTPFIKNSKTSRRVVVLSSWAHCYTDDLNKRFNNIIESKNGPGEDGYDGEVNYGWAKTSNMLFAYEYHRRNYQENKIGCVSVHPGGIIDTELGRNLNPAVLFIIKYTIAPMFFKSIEQGISTTLRCVTLTNEEIEQYGGQYFADCNPYEINKNNPPLFNYVGSKFLKDDHNPNKNNQFADIAKRFYDWTIQVIQDTGAKMSVNVN